MPWDAHGNWIKPTHPLAKWRTSERQELAKPETLDEQIADLEGRIEYAMKIENEYRRTGRVDLADRKRAQIVNLKGQLEELVGVEVHSNVEVDDEGV